MADSAPFNFDVFENYVLKNRFIPVPPAHRNQSTPNKTEFLKQGLGLLRGVCRAGLQPDNSILDLGCGIGRLALPATQFLTEHGSYFGLDINASAISWCFENISQKYPNFEFSFVSAFNKNYGNRWEYGRNSLVDLELPIAPGRRFDVICALSLFTHLLDSETEYYFCRMRDLLADGGFIYTTWFLITPESADGIRAGTSRWNFDLSTDGLHFRLEAGSKSNAIAYDLEKLLSMAGRHGLKLRGKPYFSGWGKGKIGQDLLIFEAA